MLPAAVVRINRFTAAVMTSDDVHHVTSDVSCTVAPNVMYFKYTAAINPF